jgi:hypothetical protein
MPVERKAASFAGRYGREFLHENREPQIPENGEETILRMVNRLRNSQDPSGNSATHTHSRQPGQQCTLS